MVSPDKMTWVQRFRDYVDAPLLQLPLPRINPNIITALSVVLSIVFTFLLTKPLLALVTLLLVLLLDLLDGLIAHKYHLESEEGYMIDATADRLSEGIMFIPYFIPWFFLFVVNCFLTLWSFKTKRHIVLPLRIAFLVYLAIEILM